MNAKKAKALRRVLKKLEKMSPEMQAEPQGTVYLEDSTRRKTIIVDDLENGELVKKRIEISAGTISVKKDSRRGLYLHLKKSINDPTKTAPVFSK